jgi:hypothetical protein
MPVVMDSCRRCSMEVVSGADVNNLRSRIGEERIVIIKSSSDCFNILMEKHYIIFDTMEIGFHFIMTFEKEHDGIKSCIRLFE